jgi:hypothetical protein
MHRECLSLLLAATIERRLTRIRLGSERCEVKRLRRQQWLGLL